MPDTAGRCLRLPAVRQAEARARREAWAFTPYDVLGRLAAG
ncbi:hypothetical protein ACIRP2_17540 [Streptomyces sp. NPDC101194]